jgi:hypothetical protein
MVPPIAVLWPRAPLQASGPLFSARVAECRQSIGLASCRPISHAHRRFTDGLAWHRLALAGQPEAFLTGPMRCSPANAKAKPPGDWGAWGSLPCELRPLTAHYGVGGQGKHTGAAPMLSARHCQPLLPFGAIQLSIGRGRFEVAFIGPCRYPARCNR